LEYEKVIKNYPQANKVPSALLKQGFAFLNIGDKSSAKLLLEQVVKDYPATNQARIAKAKLAKIK
jgi:TolA-binding protein